MADYLDEQCNRIDVIITKLSDEIVLLHEYRARLISDVITGKLDVREAIIPDYETMEETTEATDEDMETEDGDNE